MKRILIITAFLFSLLESHAQSPTYPLRYSVFFDSVGVQHTSSIPTKMIAITGNLNDALVKFTNLAQSGITDVNTQSQDAALFAPITGSTNYVPIARILTINGVALDLTADRSWTISTSAPVSSVFGRTGAIAAVTGDYGAFYPVLTGSYVNPTWITSLPYSKITGTPTLVSYFTNDASYAVTGNLVYATLAKTGSYTILSTDFPTPNVKTLYLSVDATAGAVTITLPTASTLTGYSIFVTKTDASTNAVTISGLSTDNIIDKKGTCKNLISAASAWSNN